MRFRDARDGRPGPGMSSGYCSFEVSGAGIAKLGNAIARKDEKEFLNHC